MKIIRLKLNTDLNGFKKGTILELPSQDDLPVSNFWYRRLKDAAIDNCVEIIGTEKVETITEPKKKRSKIDDNTI